MGAQREKALSLAKALRKGLESAGITFSGEHHITGIFPPPTTSAAALEEALRKDGFYLKVSQFPSRPRELPCIRVAFNPFHTDELIRPLITSLASQA
jgi:7-keto-8-aminopelargonate synthetase-like enzyme